MENRTLEDHMKHTNLLKPAEAAAYVYGLVKFDHVSLEEFRKLYPFINKVCKCEICGGSEGGTPGNENWINGAIVCDFCAAKRHKRETTIYIIYDVEDRAFFAKHNFEEVRIKNCIRSTYFLALIFDTLDRTIKDVKRIGLVELPFKQTSWDDLVSCKEMM